MYIAVVCWHRGMVSILTGNFNAQDFGEFMKANRLAPVLDQVQMASSSKQPVDRGRPSSDSHGHSTHILSS